MAYKTFVAGEEALAADVNSYLMSQTVARFASAAARASALPAPAVNQLSMLDTKLGGVDYWSGSAWIEVNPLVQGAQVSGTTNINGDLAVTFPRPFGMTPAVVGSGVGVNYALTAVVLGVSSTTVTFRFFNPTVVASAAVTVSYIAVGSRA